MDHNIRCECCCTDVLREPVRNLFLETEGGIWWDWLSCALFFVWEFRHNTYGLCFVAKTKQLKPFFLTGDFEKWAKDWTVNCLILTNGLSHTANYLHILYWNVCLNCVQFQLWWQWEGSYFLISVHPQWDEPSKSKLRCNCILWSCLIPQRPLGNEVLEKQTKTNK